MLPYREPTPSCDASISEVSVQPERQEGVDLLDLPVGAVLDVDTGHRTYRIENRGNGKVLIAGHPQYCPEPALVDLRGSVGPDSVLKMCFIAPGMRMEFRHPEFGCVWTSRVREVRERKAS